MIKCKSPHGYIRKCIVDCDSNETLGGSICCDRAEECKFDRSEILTKCEYAEPKDIKNEALKELFK